MASDTKTPLPVTLAFLVGLVIGVLSGSGIWSFALALALMWQSNAVRAMLVGEFWSLVGAYTHSSHHSRVDNPVSFWLFAIIELALGCVALLVYFRQS